MCMGGGGVFHVAVGASVLKAPGSVIHSCPFLNVPSVHSAVDCDGIRNWPPYLSIPCLTILLL